MSGPKPEETHGVPWADHNPTESSPPDHRREEYGEEESVDADERVTTERDDSEPESSGDA